MSKFDTYDLAQIVHEKLEAAGYQLHGAGVPLHLQPPGCVIEPTYWFTWEGSDGSVYRSEQQESELAALADAFDHYFALTVDFARAS